MDQALKQRLVGATVLIILGVILLPMLLSGQPDLQNESRRIELPDKPPELSMDTRRFPIGEHADARPSTVPETPPESAPADAGESEPVIGEATDRRVTKVDIQPRPDVAVDPEAPEENPPVPVSEPVETPPVATESATGSAQSRYLVQVASFSNPASVNKVSESLEQLGLPVLLDNVTTDAGRLHRVRVGPFDRTEEATAAIERINGLGLDLQPRVLDLRPDDNAPVTEPSDPLVRWVVQAGVFSAQKNADQVVEDLRGQGFSAFSERVTSAGKASFKVRIGPVLERQRAEQIKADLARKTGMDGLVMSVD